MRLGGRFGGGQKPSSGTYPQSLLLGSLTQSQQENRGSQFPFLRKWLAAVMLTKVIALCSENNGRGL